MIGIRRRVRFVLPYIRFQNSQQNRGREEFCPAPQGNGGRFDHASERSVKSQKDKEYAAPTGALGFLHAGPTKIPLLMELSIKCTPERA